MLYSLVRTVTLTMIWIKIRDAEAEPEARKFYRFRFHIGGKMEEEKELVLLSFGEKRIGGA